MARLGGPSIQREGRFAVLGGLTIRTFPSTSQKNNLEVLGNKLGAWELGSYLEEKKRSNLRDKRGLLSFLVFLGDFFFTRLNRPHCHVGEKRKYTGNIDPRVVHAELRDIVLWGQASGGGGGGVN